MFHSFFLVLRRRDLISCTEYRNFSYIKHLQILQLIVKRKHVHIHSSQFYARSGNILNEGSNITIQIEIVPVLERSYRLLIFLNEHLHTSVKYPSFKLTLGKPRCSR